MQRKQPRYYQLDAKKAIYRDWKQGLIPYVNMCTGSGKSLTMADITEDVLNKDKRVLQLCSTKKLVQQNYKEAYEYCTKKQDIGIACLKLGKMQTSRKAVIAMMKSFYSKRTSSGSFDVLLIDECDLVSPDENTQYRKIVKSLLRINPSMLIAGLTASPFRDDMGELFNKCKKGTPLFTNQSYETPIAKMIDEGYLSNIVDISGDIQIDLNGITTVAGDYSKDQCGVRFDAILVDAVADMRYKFKEFEINTAVIFASTVKNSYHILDEWNRTCDNKEIEMRVSHGGLSEKELDDNLKWLEFGHGRRYLINVGLYIRGFDYTALQCVCFFLATKVVSKYVQIVGRVIRAHSDKAIGYTLDYGTNISRMGPVDALTPPKKRTRTGEIPKKLCLAKLEENIEFEGIKYKKGQDCNYANLLSAKKCKKCEALFISDETGNYSMQTKAEILQAKIEADTYTYSVDKVYFEKAYSKKDQTEMIKVRFYDEDVNHIHDSYLTLNHKGWSRDNAIKMLISMLKNPSDYGEIAQFEGGVNVDNVLLLLDNDDLRQQYFKKIKSITLAPQVGGKFKELKSISYH